MEMRFDWKMILYAVIGYLVLRGIMSFFAGGADDAALLMKALTLPGLVLGLTIHEFSHAKASDKLRRSNTGKTRKAYFKSSCSFRCSGNNLLNMCWFWLGKACSN